MTDDGWDLELEIRSLSFAERSDPDNSETMRWVLKTWNRTAKRAYPGVAEAVFWQEHNSLAFHLAQRGWVIVGSFPDDLDLHIGWLAGGVEGIHWGFVKSGLRRDQQFLRLLAHAQVKHEHQYQFTALPPENWLQEALRARHYLFNPFALNEFKRERQDENPKGSVQSTATEAKRAALIRTNYNEAGRGET